jgi:hypothetical protein
MRQQTQKLHMRVLPFCLSVESNCTSTVVDVETNELSCCKCEEECSKNAADAGEMQEMLVKLLVLRRMEVTFIKSGGP